MTSLFTASDIFAIAGYAISLIGFLVLAISLLAGASESATEKAITISAVIMAIGVMCVIIGILI